VADAHVKDVASAPGHGVRFLTYWFDPLNGTAFCLADAPSPEAMQAVHRASHGLVANEVIAVSENEVLRFLGSMREPADLTKVKSAFRTILFTDIVGSTAMAADMGDHRWKDLLKRHDEAIRTELRRYGGAEIKTTGDGFLAAFQGPTSAIQCANAIQKQLTGLDLKVRAALHTGECERRGKDLSGMAVHIASRLLGHAHETDVVVSRTVKDLVVGSNLVFEERGEVTLRDVPGKWQLYCARTAPG